MSPSTTYQIEGCRFDMSGKDHIISVENKKIAVIADPHLESVANDVEYMIQFVRSLKTPEYVLVFLGDLFHVWTENNKYRTSRQKQLLDELNTFRERGGSVFLTEQFRTEGSRNS